MKRYQNIKSWTILLLVGVILLSNFSVSAQSATYTVTVHRIDYEGTVQYDPLTGDVLAGEGVVPITNATIGIWQVSDDADFEALNRQDVQSLGTPLFQGVTDSKGQIILSNLEQGTYYIRDITDPSLDPNQETLYASLIAVPLKDAPNLQQLHVYLKGQPPYTTPDNPLTLELFKFGEQRQPLSGAVFELYKQTEAGKGEPFTTKNGETIYGLPVRVHNGQVVGLGGVATPLRTDDNGIISVTGLEPGTYFFVETKAPSGYRADSNPVLVSGAASEIKRIEVENTKNSSGKKFKKVDEKGDPLAGAVFKLTVYDSENKTYKTYLQDGQAVLATSDEDGHFELIDLPPRDYTIFETVSPVKNGIKYQLLNHGISFVVDGKEDMEVIVIQNKPEGEVVPSGKTPPGKMRMPRTGDVQQLLSLVAGIGLLAVGMVLYLDKNKEKVSK